LQKPDHDESDRPVAEIFLVIDEAEILEREQQANHHDQQAHHKLRSNRASGLPILDHRSPSMR
jgi:hypothetical protein